MDKVTKQFRDFKELHIEELRDPEEARAYLEIAREEYEKDKDQGALVQAIQDVMEAQGGSHPISDLGYRINLEPQKKESVSV